MITGEYSVIRSAEPDDAAWLRRLHDPENPRSALLDPRREPLLPTVDELREVLSQKDMGKSVFHAIEDKEGNVRGFCALRGMNVEARYSEFVLLFLEDDDYSSPMAEEALAFLVRLGFRINALLKVMAHALSSEAAYRRFLVSHGFGSDGSQRDVLYTMGRWVDLEAFTLFRETALGACVPPSSD